MNEYSRVAELATRIRNARFGEMVNLTEELIDSGVWRDFTTPAGTHFKFCEWEFDYFLAAVEIDPTLIRWSYLKATDIEDLGAKQMRLADISGRGRTPDNGQRRPADQVAGEYANDPSGAGLRIREWAKSASPKVVTARTARLAQDTKRRKAVEAGKPVPREYVGSKRWEVRWRDDRPPARAIVDRLLDDPVLARDVYKALHAAESVARRATQREQRRRSEAN